MKREYFILAVIATLSYGCCKCDCDKLMKDSISTDIVSIPTDAEGKNNLPQITFEKLTHKFGEINQGDVVSCIFKFKNPGGSDLVITSASASCGCTVPEVPKLPIAPGDEGEIKVRFDSGGKEGAVKKEIVVVTNCIPNTTSLHVQAMINKPLTK